MSALNVKEAEERARLALLGLPPGQHGSRIVDLEMPRDVLALADLARRLAEEHEYSPDTGDRPGHINHSPYCSRCKALAEARKVGLHS